MNFLRQEKCSHNRGSILPLVIVIIVILLLLGIGLLTVAYGVRMRAIQFKNQTAAMLAAEAGYEQGIFWMNKQSDVLDSLPNPNFDPAIDLGDSSYTYSVTFGGWAGGLPIFRVLSTGRCADTQRAVDVFVVQAVSGWDMGMCRIPDSLSSTGPVYFAGTEIIDIPIHINNLKDNPDERDIYISGSPQFNASVEMGESQHRAGGADKYSGVMDLFDGDIYFDQPDVRITDAIAVQKKIARFQTSTADDFRFDGIKRPKPIGTANLPTNNLPTKQPQSAVQLEFYVDGADVGRVRIKNNCTVSGYLRITQTHDYRINPAGGGNTYSRYLTYAYHYCDTRDTNPATWVNVTDVPIEQTYVRQNFAGQESEPCGQIYVDGNVVIGGDGSDLFNHPLNQVVKGKLTVVATGNIWIADSIVVDGTHNIATPDGALPALDNENALGLIALGVVKVIDPGISGYGTGSSNFYPGPPSSSPIGDIDPSSGRTHSYVPVANDDPGSGQLYDRILPDSTVVEAAVTVGGGGWGAENVREGSFGGRKEFSGTQDALVLRGTICESVRGIVGIINDDGYLKHYYLDRRLLEGVLPGNIWFGGKYVPAPAGWRDYRASN